MLFNSYIFIFIFLPLCLGGYFLLNRFSHKTLSLVWLLGMSLWFYGYFNVGYLAIIISSILINFGFYLLSARIKGKKLRLFFKTLAVLANLGILFYYKYFDFFLTNVNTVFGTDYVLRGILLPLGISFFTFQQISLVIDAFNGEVPHYSFISYACFVTFFPQLIAGPIVTHDELIPQLMSDSNKRFNWDNFSAGLYLFTLGLSKKVLLADVLGGGVNYGFQAIGDYHWETMNSLSVLIVIFSYTLQLYFDFSGYSDMAVGIGKMFNIDLPQNFDSPYKSLTIPDFWRSWHITLMRFLRKYVYFPLGGSRKGTKRTYFNILTVYIVSGIWHGANWTFMAWGALHGVFSIAARMGDRIIRKLPDFVNRAITFILVMFALVLFRADTLKDAVFMIARLFRLIPGSVCEDIVSCFSRSEYKALLSVLPECISQYSGNIIMVLFLAVCTFIVFVPRNSYERMQSFRPCVKNSLLTVFLLIWCVFSFSGVSSFLYFNF